MFDPDELLNKLAEDDPRVLFYPSSGRHHEKLFDLDYDIFILADYYPKTHEEQELFFEEMRQSDTRIRLYKSTVQSRICKVNEKWVFLFF